MARVYQTGDAAGTPSTRLDSPTLYHTPHPEDVQAAENIRQDLGNNGVLITTSPSLGTLQAGKAVVLITQNFLDDDTYVAIYKGILSDRDKRFGHVAVMYNLVRSDLPFFLRNQKYLNTKGKNFIYKLMEAIKGGGIEILIPKLSLKIKPNNLNADIMAMLHDFTPPPPDQINLHKLWDDVYNMSLAEAKDNTDNIYVLVAVREKQGIQKLASDINSGMVKKGLIELLGKSRPKFDAGLAESVSVTFDMKEYTVACDKLKEDEEETLRLENGGELPQDMREDPPEVATAASSDYLRRARSADLLSGSLTPTRVPQPNSFPATKPPTAAAGNIANVIAGILFSMIANKNYFCYDFEMQLRKLFQHRKGVAGLYNDDGMSLLHAVVMNVRPTFFSVLFRNALWEELIYMKVEMGKSANWSGLTAKEICEKRGRSRKVLSDVIYFSAWEKSLQPIHKAARAGQVDKVSNKLKKGDPLEEKDNVGATPLYWAVVSGNTDLVTLLLNKGARTDVTTDRGETLLHVATHMGHADVIRVLLRKCPSLDPDLQDTYKKSAWDRNGERGDIETLKAYVECGKEIPGNVLTSAAFHGRILYIRHVTSGYDVDIDAPDTAGRSALLRAVESGHLDIIKHLIEKGADMKWTDRRGRNILHVLADGGHVTCLATLLEKAREQNVLGQLINATDKYVGGELCFLIRGKDKGRQAWHYVEVKRRLVHVFLKKTRGGSVDVALYGNVVKSGWGPDPEQEIVDMIDKRFEERRTNNTTESDQTPLHIAVFKPHPAIAQALIAAGADLEARDCFGLTPMHIAAMRGDMEIVKVMDAKGVTLTVEDMDGKTPADVAEDNEHIEMGNFIKGNDYFSRAEKFVNEEMAERTRMLSREYLQKMRNEGKDVKKHLIAVLRDITIDVNGFLLDLGSGPVQEETH